MAVSLMMQALTRRHLLTTATATTAIVVAAPHIARAETTAIRWRCATAWSRNLPGPGTSARRLADRIRSLSRGAVIIDIFAAGEIVPALQTFDAVASGSVEMAHTASLFWGGKIPAAPFFTTVPFGPGPTTHMAWLQAEGQVLWDELYAPHRLKPFVGGNTGPSAAGWFKRPIVGLDDIRGLRIRATGLGGEVYAALGATAIALAPSDTYAAFERGVVDAVELLAPANDLPLGFNRLAPHYMFPGFNKPNGPSEVLIGEKAWASLSGELKELVAVACHLEHATAIVEAHAENARAIETLAAGGTNVVALPAAVLDAARLATGRVLDRVQSTSPMADRIGTSLRRFTERSQNWHRYSQGSTP